MLFYLFYYYVLFCFIIYVLFNVTPPPILTTFTLCKISFFFFLSFASKITTMMIYLHHIQNITENQC